MELKKKTNTTIDNMQLPLIVYNITDMNWAEWLQIPWPKPPLYGQSWLKSPDSEEVLITQKLMYIKTSVRVQQAVCPDP